MSKKMYYRATAFFSLLISQEISQTIILMQLHTRCVSTRAIPEITTLLSTHCPSVLQTTCFNGKNLPFWQEVRATELGHLFEHILLEELCMHKLACGYDSAEFNGRTFWNWVKEPRGLFRIKINASYSDQLFFPQALSKSIQITQLLMSCLPSVPSRSLHYSPEDLSRYLVA